jgi:hypothetical protein
MVFMRCSGITKAVIYFALITSCVNSRRFTYKVTVQIKGPSETLLECYSDAKLQKKAAQEHAAQGALWYLKQDGYLPKDEIRL